MTSQEDLNVNDVVIVHDDYRRYLNGRQGKIIEIIDGSAIVEFDHVGRSREAIVYIVNLKKVEEKP